MASFQLEIVTPESRVYQGEVTSVKVPAADGSFEILTNHAPIIATLANGALRVIDASGKRLDFTTQEGVVEVLNNKVSVLVEKVLSGLEQLQTED